MALLLDVRIPVRFAALADVGPDDATLVEGLTFPTPDEAPTRPAPCACCGARGKAAEALSRLFMARARGETAAFTRVAAVTQTVAGHQAVIDALASDPIASVRFRLDPS